MKRAGRTLSTGLDSGNGILRASVMPQPPPQLARGPLG